MPFRLDTSRLHPYIQERGYNVKIASYVLLSDVCSCASRSGGVECSNCGTELDPVPRVNEDDGHDGVGG